MKCCLVYWALKPSTGNPKPRAMINPAFSRERRPPLVWKLAGPKAEAEMAGKGGEGAAGGEAAADEGDRAAASGPTSAAQTTTLRQNAFLCGEKET